MDRNPDAGRIRGSVARASADAGSIPAASISLVA